MSDKSDMEDTEDTLNYSAGDTHQMKEHDDMQQQQEDDFGSFDDAQEDDDFGDFEEEEQELEVQNNTPIFSTMQDAMGLWQQLLDQIYHYKELDSFTGNAPKSIKQYVLEEAPESLHSRLTWDSVTRYMENDTGIPKVKWHQSEIERYHLNALACKRSATPIIPTMLNTDITREPQHMMGMKPVLDTVIGSNVAVTAAAANPVVDQPTTPNSSANTPTTPEKRSSVFGLSSLSRFLPHLSKSNLPKSPTTGTTNTAPTSPITASKSLPRQQSTTINHLNVSTLKQQDAGLSSIKRSNSVAFTSRRDPFAPSSPMQQHTAAKPRPTSFQAPPPPPPPSMDLFDLTEDPTTIVKSPTQLQFNFKPLIPTHALSPTPVRRNTIPADMHLDIQPTAALTNASLDTIPDDEFGDFTAEAVKQDFGQTQEKEDDFGDFSQKGLAPAKSANFIDDDPFGIMGSNSNTITGSKQTSMSPTNDDDPYGIASYAQHSPHPPPVQQSNQLISTEYNSSTPQSQAITALPKVTIPTTFDLLTPIASGLNPQSNNTALNCNKSAEIWNTSNQKPKIDTKIVDNDDDDWGDWAF